MDSTRLRELAELLRKQAAEAAVSDKNEKCASIIDAAVGLEFLVRKLEGNKNGQ